MTTIEALNLLVSSGTLVGVLRLVWLLSRHDTMLEQHHADIQTLFKLCRKVNQ